MLRLTAGFGMRREMARARLCTRLKCQRRATKSTPCLIKKVQGVRQIARLKQQRCLSFTFYVTQRSYEKIMCIYLLFDWFSGGNCIDSHFLYIKDYGLLQIKKKQE